VVPYSWRRGGPLVLAGDSWDDDNFAKVTPTAVVAWRGNGANVALPVRLELDATGAAYATRPTPNATMPATERLRVRPITTSYQTFVPTVRSGPQITQRRSQLSRLIAFVFALSNSRGLTPLDVRITWSIAVRRNGELAIGRLSVSRQDPDTADRRCHKALDFCDCPTKRHLDKDPPTVWTKVRTNKAPDDAVLGQTRCLMPTLHGRRSRAETCTTSATSFDCPPPVFAEGASNGEMAYRTQGRGERRNDYRSRATTGPLIHVHPGCRFVQPLVAEGVQRGRAETRWSLATLESVDRSSVAP